jgi:dimethylsulfone monooxygenase
VLTLPTDRPATNPLFNSNHLKLGVFAANVSHGCSFTTVDGTLQTTWPSTSTVARLADDAGFEAMVPVGRWKGAGGTTNFNGASFETYTWAAGLGAQTRNIALLATSHVTTIHPVVAAKMISTVDHITGGRFGLNVVCGGGFFTLEAPMFGAPRLEHDLAYEYATEWLDVCRQLWTRQEQFDYDGRFFNLRGLFHEPKPLQRPHPAVMNAGTSDIGKDFAAREADMIFIHTAKGQVKERVDSIRVAARAYGREIQVWGHAHVVCRPTEKEARDYLDYYVREKGDWEAATNVMGNGRPGQSPAAVEDAKFRLVAGWYGYPMIGPPDLIAAELQELSAAGLDGCVLSWVNYQDELAQFIQEVLPLLEQAGLRRPFTAANPSPRQFTGPTA